MLTVLKQEEKIDCSAARRAITINGIRIDLATAKHITTHPGGDVNFDPHEERRFDEELYKTPEGYFFIVRPLAPDEARAWLEAHDDEALLQQMFPDDAAD